MEGLLSALGTLPSCIYKGGRSIVSYRLPGGGWTQEGHQLEFKYGPFSLHNVSQP